MIRHKLLGTTQATWGQGPGIGASILVTGGAFELVLQIEDRTLADGCNFNWPGLVLTGRGAEHHEHENDKHQNTDGRERVAVRLVEVEHLL